MTATPAVAIVDGQLRIAPAVAAVAVQTLDWIHRKVTHAGDATLGVGVSIVLMMMEQMPREQLRETSAALVATLQRFTNELLNPPLVVPQ